MEQKVKISRLEDKLREEKINRLANLGTAAVVSGIVGVTGIGLAVYNKYTLISLALGTLGIAGAGYFSSRLINKIKYYKQTFAD